MNRNKNLESGPVFLCFSPAAMLVTFIIEIALVGFIVWRYKMTSLTKLAVATIVALAVFQLAEYSVCEGDHRFAEAWSRAGFVAITLLPVLGAHMAHILIKSPTSKVLPALYVAAVAFSSVFLFGDVFQGNLCTGNYVIFHLDESVGGLYFLYYYLLLLGTIIWVLRVAHDAGKKLQKTLHLYILSYLVFIVPTAIITVWRPQTLDGIPSIMCGFAILFALLLSLVILPRAQKKKTSKTS